MALVQKTCNTHFFVNSVRFISQVIRQAELSPEDVRVVCSQHGDSPQKIMALGAGFEIGNTLDPVRKINFYTSTCFEGCDIYDPKGKAYIVSEGHQEHTLLDIPTTFRQVCGRLRDTRYRDQVTLIFSSSYTGNPITVQDFTDRTMKTYREAQAYCRMIEQLDDRERELHHRIHAGTTFLDERYITWKDGRLSVDIDRLRFEIVQFRLKNKVYTTSYQMRQELITQGIHLKA